MDPSSLVWNFSPFVNGFFDGQVCVTYWWLFSVTLKVLIMFIFGTVVFSYICYSFWKSFSAALKNNQALYKMAELASADPTPREVLTFATSRAVREFPILGAMDPLCDGEIQIPRRDLGELVETHGLFCDCELVVTCHVSCERGSEFIVRCGRKDRPKVDEESDIN